MGSFQHLISSLLYFIGTFLLNPACILMLPFGNFLAGIMILISACSYLTLAAIVDVDRIIFKSNSSMLQQLNATCMLFGGLFFLVAAVLYLPSWGSILNMSAASLGTWVFRIGSVLYLSGSFISLYIIQYPPQPEFKYDSLTEGHEDYCRTGETPLLTPSKHNIGDNLSEVRAVSSTTMWLLVVCNYVIGAILYIIGGVLFQYFHAAISGTVVWCIGSFLFLTGAFLQLYEVVLSFGHA